MARLPRHHITLPRGFFAGGNTCQIKPSGQPDLAILRSEVRCAGAGVFTTNQMPGAPVIVSKSHLRNGAAQAIVCNSGIANVCTGEQGLADARQMCQWTADHLQLKTTDVLVCSTGVIGQPLPMDKIQQGIISLTPALGRGSTYDAQAAHAILTTDQVIKTASCTFKLAGQTAHLGGIAKGSGMIAPNMATMLGFLTTDVAITPGLLRQVLRRAVNVSFNRICVDEDTSTSDSVLILANGLAGHPPIQTPGKHLNQFEEALTHLCKQLAYQVVADGEGATRVFRVTVQQAASPRDAHRIGKTIVSSPLVKTAIHGSDPNWGRLVMAIGRSGAKVQPDLLEIAIGNIPVCQHGQPVKLSRPLLRKLEAHMRRKEVQILVSLHLGKADSQWLGCDLSRDYVAINADYTT